MNIPQSRIRITCNIFNGSTVESRYLEPQWTERKNRVIRSSTKEKCKNPMSMKGEVTPLGKLYQFSDLVIVFLVFDTHIVYNLVCECFFSNFISVDDIDVAYFLVLFSVICRLFSFVLKISNVLFTIELQ